MDVGAAVAADERRFQRERRVRILAAAFLGAFVFLLLTSDALTDGAAGGPHTTSQVTPPVSLHAGTRPRGACRCDARPPRAARAPLRASG